MRCRDCGHENPDDASFCGNCGSRLALEVPCPNCGRENPADLRFCPGCGASLADPAPDAATSDGAAAGGAPAPAEDPTQIAGGRYLIRDFLGV